MIGHVTGVCRRAPQRLRSSPRTLVEPARMPWFVKIICRGGSVPVRAAFAAVALIAIVAASVAAQDVPAPVEPPLVPGSSTSSQSPAAGEPPASASADNPVWRFFARTQVTGLVDFYYSYNFNTPKAPCSVSAGVSIFNCLHAFDVAPDGFSLNLAEVALEKKPTNDSRVGYRLDLDVGAGASLVATFEPGGSGAHLPNRPASLRQLPRSGGKRESADRPREIRDARRLRGD